MMCSLRLFCREDRATRIFIQSSDWSEARILHISFILHEDIEYHLKDVIFIGHDLAFEIIHHIFSEIIESLGTDL